MQLTVFTAREGARFFHRLVDTLQQFADFLQKKFSFCRECYAARATAQKIDADLILQVLDLSTQCWLRDSKAGRALLKFKTSPTARKYLRCRNSIVEIHYAAKAWQREEHGIGRIASPLVRNNYANRGLI